METATCFLSDLISVTNGKSCQCIGGKYPIYGGNGIAGYADSFNSEDCIVVGRVGVYCGSLYYVEDRCWVTDNALIVKAKQRYDQKFLFYLLKTLHLNEYRIGSTQPLITKTILNSFEVKIPIRIEDQQAIASILSIFDNQIKNLDRINDNLFSILRAQYRRLISSDCSIHLLSEIAIIDSGKRPN